MEINLIDTAKTYRSKKMPPVEALKGVSFKLPSAGLVFILGKSGCGKTMLLNILGGLDDFDGGDVTVNGRSFKSFTQKDYDDYRNNCVGFVFQENNLFDEYTAEYNVSMALSLQSVNDGDKKTYAALKAVGLEDYGNVKPNRLSGGQKQRVAIARAIVKNPQLLLCDEPTGALDSETGATIFELLKQISKNTLVVVVSHDRESAEKYGDRIIELKSGKIISDSGEKNQQPCCQNAIAPAILADETPLAAKKRGGMPFKTLFGMGAAMLVARPVRLVLCCLICLLAFTILGVADTINAYDCFVALVNSLDAINADYVSLNVKVEGKQSAYEGLTLRQYEFLKSNVKSDRLYKVYGSLGVGVGPIKELDVDVGWGSSVGYNTYAGGVAGKLVESADRDMRTLKPLFTWVSVAMVVLSALMILYYASGVVQEKRREIGILRALGAGERDIAAIFAINNGIFVVTIIVLSCLLAAVGAVLANSCIIAAYSIAATVIPFGIRQILVLAGVAIIAMVVGIAVPVIRLMRSKPVDIIAGRQ